MAELDDIAAADKMARNAADTAAFWLALQAAFATETCAKCNRPFAPTRRTQIYCTPQCRWAAKRRRQRQAAAGSVEKAAH